MRVLKKYEKLIWKFEIIIAIFFVICYTKNVNNKLKKVGTEDED